MAGKIAIVGEIYIKYNAFGNQFLAEFLMENRVEPVIPPILDYFIQDFVNYRENIRAHIRHRKITDILGRFIETFLNTFHRKSITDSVVSVSIPRFMTSAKWRTRPERFCLW